MKNIAACVALFLGLIASSLAQTASPTQSSSPVNPCDTDFAKFLVSQQVADSASVTDEQKRIRILIRSADFLWRFDEPAARGYLTDAFKIAVDRFAAQGFEEIKIGDGRASKLLPDFRFEVISAVAKKDPAWAKQLVEQILKDFERSGKERKEYDKTRELDSIMRLAIESLKVNPALSQQLFRRAMQFPLDRHWYFALYQAADADQALASTLYGELIASFRNETPRRLLFLSAYPFGHDRIMGPDRFSFGVSMPASFRPEDALQRRFITTFLERVIAMAATPESVPPTEYGWNLPESAYAATAVKEIEPVVVGKFPDLLPLYSRARAAAESLLTDEARKKLSERENSAERLSRSFDRRIRDLEEAEGQGKLTDEMIASLVTWGQKTEPQFKQLESWLDKIKDNGLRKDLTTYFWFLRSQLAIKENRLTDAEKFTEKVGDVEFRAILAFGIAEKQIADLNDRASVYQTLAAVAKMAGQLDDNMAKARIFLGLVNRYESIDHIFAMEELAGAVRALNRIENPDIFASAVFRQIKGENFSFFTSYSMPGYDLEQTFEKVSKNDFDMSLSNAKAIDDKYLRTIAVIAVAKNCVKDQPAKPTKRAK
jgi:hypothetical protein